MIDEGFSNSFDLFDLYVSRDEYYQQVETSLQDPNATNDNGYTLLHAAASRRRRNNRIVQLLLLRGADVNAVTPLGYTPLHLAAASRGRKNVDMLIENGASLTAQDFKGRTALHYAIGESLYESPFPHFIHAYDNQIVKRLLRESELCINARDEFGETPLMWAVNERMLSAVWLLLNKGADPNIPNISNQSPLHRALSGGRGVNEHIVLELLKAGAGIYSEDNMGQTAIYILLLKVRNDHAFEFAIRCLSLIALRLQPNDYLRNQIAKVPMLSQPFGEYCKEVYLMKRVILQDKFTLHDFVLNCFQWENRREINSAVVEILLSGLFPEYFHAILNRLSKQGLRDILAGFTNLNLLQYQQPRESRRLELFNMIRYFYDTNVYLRRQLITRIENLLSIFQNC